MNLSQSKRPRLLDLFCGAGGAATGYHRAGFDVVGIDDAPQPNYPFQFIRADALSYLSHYPLDSFDAIHASPPCPAFSLATSYHPGAREKHPDLLTPTRELLLKTGLPFVIENVEGAPLRRDLVLCGEMFDLRVHRHRIFECEGWMPLGRVHAPHRLRGAKHNCHIEEGYTRIVAGNMSNRADAADAMGIDWPMTTKELANAIPPFYTEFIGHQLLAAVSQEAIAA